MDRNTSVVDPALKQELDDLDLTMRMATGLRSLAAVVQGEAGLAAAFHNAVRHIQCPVPDPQTMAALATAFRVCGGTVDPVPGATFTTVRLSFGPVGLFVYLPTVEDTKHIDAAALLAQLDGGR